MALHIGKEIEHKYKESGLKLSEFARRMNTSPRNVYDIFDRSEIKTDQLTKVCEVLNFNFFSFYQPQGKVQEPVEDYQKKPSVSIVVELDGDEETLNEWVRRLTALNKALH